MSNGVDLRVYLILGVDELAEQSLSEIASAAASGGVTLVQLRAKTADTRTFVAAARAVKAVLAPFKVPLLINDRIDVALAVDCAGVHIGQQDMAPADARRLLGDQAVIGLTVRSLAEASAAPLELLDYVSIGGVFVTRSKDNPDPPIGLDGLAEIAQSLRNRSALPLCAIAGIGLGNAAATIEAGVDGLAVISVIADATHPEQATAALRNAVDIALSKRKPS